MLQLIGIVLLIFPFWLTSIYNHPSIDDYWNANINASHSFIEGQQYFYSEVSGRFFSNFLMSLFNSLRFNSVIAFKIWPILISLFLIYSIFFFLQTFAIDKKERIDNLYLSILIILVHIVSMRSLYEGLYWMSSTIIYQLCIGMLLLFFAHLLRFKKQKKQVNKIVAIILCMLIQGTAEVVYPFYFLILAVLFCLYYSDNIFRKAVYLCAFFSFAAFIMNSCSGGTLNRLSHDVKINNHGIFAAIYLSLKSVCYYTLLWCSSPTLLAAMLIMLPFLNYYSKGITCSNFLSTHRKPIWILLFFMAYAVVGISMYFPLFYFEAIVPTARLTTLIFALFFSFFIVGLIAILRYNTQLQNMVDKHIQKPLYTLITFAFFAVTLFLNKNYQLVVKGLVAGDFKRFDKEMNARIETIKSCEQDTCYIPYLTKYPIILTNVSPMDINKDKSTLKLQRIYFKKKAIVYKK